MRAFFRAVALDYDGTLTAHERPEDEVLAALRAAREEGRKLVLVTGRILEELRAVFPDVADHFDLIVAENGALLVQEGGMLPLARPVPVALDAALVERGVAFRRGHAILATSGKHDMLLLEQIRRLGLDCQLMRNRGELMVLPAGVSKGAGLRHGLAQLGISPHSTIAVGDAENDLSLLEVCELGVAVANAVDSLKEHADVVLREPAGQGVTGLLRGPLLRGEMRIEPTRWQVGLGHGPSGEWVGLPASQIDLLVAGGSGSGKSFAAGLVAEQLVRLGYSICVLDPEGDHAPLGHLPGIVALGGRQALPDPEDVIRIIEQGGASVVVDGSLSDVSERDSWMCAMLARLEARREEHGLPHWVILDEAQTALHPALVEGSFRPELKGHALVTWHPDHLAPAASKDLDFLLLVAGEQGIDREVARAACARAGVSWDAVAPRNGVLHLGEALLVRAGPHPEVRVLALGSRWVRHVRHWHKYVNAQLPAERRFYFRREEGATGAQAANLGEFRRELLRAPPDSMRHHARGSDFSRWLGDVIRDERLAATVRQLEYRLRAAGDTGEVEQLREQILEEIEARYAS